MQDGADAGAGITDHGVVYPAALAEGTTTAWGLPGAGVGAPDCGEYRAAWLCGPERIAWRIRRSCRRRECPDCAPQWVRVEASIACDRILGHPLGGTATRHGIVSPAPDWRPTEVERKRMAARMRRGLAAEGWLGYCVVYHPYRGCESAGYDVVGGHWHIVGWKRYARGRWKGWDAGGIVYKNVRLRGGLTVRSRLISTLLYELGHAGIARGKTAIQWCGGLSYNKIQKDERKGGESAPDCPSCGRRLVAMKCIVWEDRTGIEVLFYGESTRFSVHDWPDPRERLA